MKRIIIAAVALFAVTILFDTAAQAQGIKFGSRGFSAHGRTNINAFRAPGIRGRGLNAYGLGGFGYGGNFISAFSNTVRPERQPFFATNPPVYYSGIVKRPYGISPHAAPAGTLPAEMQVPHVQPVTMMNPFFKEVVPVSETNTETVDETDNKTTMTTNPYYQAETDVVVDAVEDVVNFASLETFVEEN